MKEAISIWDYIKAVFKDEILYESEGISYLNISGLECVENSIRDSHYGQTKNSKTSGRIKYTGESEKRTVIALIDAIIDREEQYYYKNDIQYHLTDEELDVMKNIFIRIDSEVSDYNSFARRPYYRMRGKK